MTVARQKLADAIRVLAMDAVEAANSGHPGMPMGMAEAATVLFTRHLKCMPQDPRWADRDRFVLSAGHGSMLIYALLYLMGYERPTIGDIRDFRQLGSVCAGHPENFELAGIETTTGPLGQGFATAVGMAIAERHLNAHYGDDLVDHRTWVIAGDGCLMEGINHEAIGLAASLGLGRLNVLWDDNSITIDGKTSLSTVEDIGARYAATGWHFVRCDGHDFEALDRAMAEALADPRPSLIACRTVIGKGAPNKGGTKDTHGSPLGAGEVAATREAIGWESPAFEMPEAILSAWRDAGRRSAGAYQAWNERLAASAKGAEFTARMAGETGALPSLDRLLAEFAASPKAMATRKASEMVLGAVTADLPSMVGGSADLTPSNLTRPAALPILSRADYGGRYIHYGIREFAMSAAMNGMALHGGIIPYGGTFLVFSDYARGAIRLSALQRTRVVYVFTHDSIGVGEDGPTHQPIEHVMSLRLVPNLHVFRPCDPIETAECWALALARTDGPAVLALSRQNLAPQRTDATHNRSAQGAYRLVSAEAPRQVVLVATGSEVEIAVGVAERLEAAGIGADVVSMPCAEIFARQSDAYRRDILPDGVLRVSIEAGSSFGWASLIGEGLHIGIDSFGVCGPGTQVYQHFGLTPDAICMRVRSQLAGAQAR